MDGSHLAHWEEHTVPEHLHTNGSHAHHWYRRVHAKRKDRGEEGPLSFMWTRAGQEEAEGGPVAGVEPEQVNVDTLRTFPNIPWPGPMRDAHIVGGDATHKVLTHMFRCEESRFKKLVPPRDPSALPNPG